MGLNQGRTEESEWGYAPGHPRQGKFKEWNYKIKMLWLDAFSYCKAANACFAWIDFYIAWIDFRETTCFLSALVFRYVKCLYNENNGQRKRYKRHFADVSVTSVTIISTFANVVYIVFFGRYFHYKTIQHFCFSCIKCLYFSHSSKY